MLEYTDRADAGRQLAQRIAALRFDDVVILGLPRGGVPVAYEVAKTLGVPLDVIVVRKLGVPFHPELAMGAIGEGNIRFLDQETVARGRLTEGDVAAVEERERRLLNQRVARYRQGRPRVDLHGRTAIVVDDGIATGSTARVACRAARMLGAQQVIMAVPVAPAGTAASFLEADETICLMTPRDFRAVGYHYRDFSPVEDEEVVRLLDAAASMLRPPEASGADHGYEHRAGNEHGEGNDVGIPAGSVRLQGNLHEPPGCRAVVIFANGSGSSRQSPRNRFVARALNDAGLGTLLLDLLTPAEERDRSNVFNIPLLAERLHHATRWIEARHAGSRIGIGYFGASTGAGAALWAAAEPQANISAVVCRGGRPDLAGDKLAAVRAPTLFIVGGADTHVLELNRQAMARIGSTTVRLDFIPGATHLFEEAGTLDQVAALAADWFARYLLPAASKSQASELLP
ncbi:phosphoribosyltransferase family protein [Paenarthrobacter sp. YJN-5]|uniref:phosphoribosyltransferase family protein n=1 Tax=Paenarthrobacter sp. YJN-5 TaxID=2735316 RepID=UPI001877CB4A|nr:phosphoribosyltransferase family protein [Paenarthrobacter sp. YJN-5]QOT19049.1 phosphoribosyltransferase [Paenarthrobacter sp. YJN-5]